MSFVFLFDIWREFLLIYPVIVLWYIFEFLSFIFVKLNVLCLCDFCVSLHLKMHVPSQEYYSCCPFVWCVLSFSFTFLLGTFRSEFSSEFRFFEILLFTTDFCCIMHYWCTWLYLSFLEQSNKPKQIWR